MTGPAMSMSDWPCARGGGVEVDEAARPGRRQRSRGAGDHHAAVAVPDQDDIVQVPVEQQLNDVVDVGVEVDVRRERRRTASARPVSDGANTSWPSASSRCFTFA